MHLLCLQNDSTTIFTHKGHVSVLLGTYAQYGYHTVFVRVSQCKSFDDWVPVNSIYGCPDFKRAAENTQHGTKRVDPAITAGDISNWNAAQSEMII